MKKNRILILHLILIVTTAIIGCDDGDGWEEVELQNKTCNSNLTTVVTYNNTVGTVVFVEGANENEVYIRIANPDPAQETEYCLPCNLPDEYKVENLQIRFNGDLKSLAGYFEEPGTEIIVISQPLTLTRLWVIE